MDQASRRHARIGRIVGPLAAAALLVSLLPPTVSAAGAPDHLVFGTQPTNSAATSAISPFTVQIVDAQGDVTTSTASVTVAIGSNPGGGTLTGTATVAAVAGVATFSGLSINNAGIGYTLAASSTGLAGATSSAFTIFGDASQLVFGTQPGNSAANATITPAVTVRIADALGTTVPTSSASVTVAIGTNPASGTLAGTKTVSASNGVATFSDLAINNAGIGYTLTATSSGLNGATSNAFTIYGSPSALAFSTQPTNTVAGASITPAVTVRIIDALGSTVATSSASVTVAIGTNPASGTLSGTKTVSASNGVAAFGNLSIDKAGVGYTLKATSAGLADATSTAFTIVGQATHLVFGTQPTSTAPNVAISPAVTVRILDVNGTLTNSNANVTIAIGTNPASGTLSGTKTVTAVGGIATFSNLSINNAGTGYTLLATSTGLTQATSSVFSISVQHLAFTTQPGGGAPGVVWSQQPIVAVENASNQVVTTDNTTVVTLSIATNPAGGTLTCTNGNSRTVVNGVAVFSGCSINIGSSSSYTLTAASTPPWTAATSNSFLISLQHLSFTTSPGGGSAGATWGKQPVVAILNSSNQVVTTDNTTIVTLSIGSNPAGGTLTCTSGTSRRVVNGLATFYGCSINLGSSSAYTLVATSSPAISSATSSAFYVGATITFATGTALGNTLIGPFTKTTKIAHHGGYITWRFDGGPMAANQTIQIWAYKKTSLYGPWSPVYLLTTRHFNSSGVAYANIRSYSSSLWLSIRPVLGTNWGPTSIGRWIR